LYNIFMPSRNRVKLYSPESYYHIYNRGVNRRRIFIDNDDYAVFLNLLKRYLCREEVKDAKGRQYESMYGKIELLAFCLMPNHFHLLIFQKDAEAMTKLLHKITGSYTRYFNKKHKRSGPLFQDRFKASQILSDEYLIHISRYIHLNPRGYLAWEYSSLPYYTGRFSADWVMSGRVMSLFEGDDYLTFLKDYEGHNKMLDQIKDQLANKV
jgi:putative transposase